MNYARLALAAIVATVVDGLYGLLVYGTLLTSEFARFPGVYRPAETQGPYMLYLFAGVLLAMFAAAYIYAKGYEGGSGAAEGARFGVAIGLFAVGYAVLVSYATTNIGGRITLALACAAVVEWTIDGIVIGLLYSKGAPARK